MHPEHDKDMECVSQPRVLPPQQSAFFPSMQRRDSSQQPTICQPAASNNDVVMEPFRFPATKNILWDRKPQGDSEHLHLSSRRHVRVMINEQTLRLAVRHLNQSASPFDCFLIGSVSVDSREEGLDLMIDRFDPGREVKEKNGIKRKVPTAVVPGDQIVPIKFIKGLSGADNSVSHSKEEFSRALTVLHSRVSGQDALSLSNFLSIKACCHAHADDDEVILNLHFGAITMVTGIIATPVSAVPIIPTALARNLSGPLRLSDVQGTPKCGFLTMDHTRKLLLILESDPKAFSLPLIGIWVSGPFTVHHPYVWACCLKFINCAAIQQRVLSNPNSFLLVHYSPAQTTPIFWECSPQEQLKPEPFELFSCYENLHFEVPFSTKFSEPLCFDLLPCGDNINRRLFEQALSSWTNSRENSDSTKSNALAHQHRNADNQEGNMIPRPSPSPHPQTRQNPLLMPAVPEVSLSLSFEEPFPQHENQPQGSNKMTHQQSNNPVNDEKVFPEQRKQVRNSRVPGLIEKKTNKPNGTRSSPNQENRVLPYDPRQSGKQVLTGLPRNSPQREPLKQIMEQNQTLGTPKQMKNLPNSNTPGGTKATNGQFPRGQPPSNKGPNVACSESNPKLLRPPGRGRGGRRGRDGTATRVMQRGTPSPRTPNQQMTPKIHVPPNFRVTSSNMQGDDDEGSVDIECSKHSDDCPNQGGFGNDTRSHNSPNVLPNDGKIPDDDELQNPSYENSHAKDDGAVQEFYRRSSQQIKATTQKNSSKENRESARGSPDRANFQDSGVGESSIDWTRSGDSPGNDSMAAVPSVQRVSSASDALSHPDPYELLMRQEQQLKELQEQIKLLLLHQQSNTQPSSTLSPPQTPEMPAESSNQATSSPVFVTKVTMCTNTGASLMLSSPIVARHHKKSAATSPMRNTCHETRERKRSKRLSSKSSPSNQKTVTQGSNTSLSSSHSSCGSNDASGPSCLEEDNTAGIISPGTLTLNADARRGLVPDEDPNQTLASSVHAVDFHSYVGSPEASERRMDKVSFCSPVLGESASILVEQREGASDSPNSIDKDTPKSNEVYDSMLYKNEKLFYDNLLAKARELLCKQVEEKKDSPNTSIKSSHATLYSSSVETSKSIIHEPTQEEVVMATVKELEKMRNGQQIMDASSRSTTGAKLFSKHLPFHRSSSMNAIADHPCINYVSLALDDGMDEVFSEADSLALKYLNDEQLQELRQLTSKCHSSKRHGPAATQPNLSAEKQSVVDCTWNNLSMATQNYLEKYHLVSTKVNNNPRERSGSVEENAALRNRRSLASNVSSGEVSPSLQCSAPPPTPEPREPSEKTTILDIQRLRKLPKLF